MKKPNSTNQGHNSTNQKARIRQIKGRLDQSKSQNLSNKKTVRPNIDRVSTIQNACFSLALKVGDARDPVLEVLHHLGEHEAEGTQANLPRRQRWRWSQQTRQTREEGDEKGGVILSTSLGRASWWVNPTTVRHTLDRTATDGSDRSSKSYPAVMIFWIGSVQYSSTQETSPTSRSSRLHGPSPATYLLIDHADPENMRYLPWKIYTIM